MRSARSNEGHAIRLETWLMNGEEQTSVLLLCGCRKLFELDSGPGKPVKLAVWDVSN